MICLGIDFIALLLTLWALQVKLSSCQRIVLLNYNKETNLIDFRHYSIRLQPVGVSRRIRKFVQNHQVPDLRSLQDVSDFVTRYLSPSHLSLSFSLTHTMDFKFICLAAIPLLRNNV